MRTTVVPPKTRKVTAFSKIAVYECPCGKEAIIAFFPKEDNIGIVHESPVCAQYIDEDAPTFLATLKAHGRRRGDGSN